eukprot:scaffold5592_cov16-Tisochrysis_lutea.AAC.1
MLSNPASQTRRFHPVGAPPLHCHEPACAAANERRRLIMNNEWALLDTLDVEMSLKEKEARQKHLQQLQCIAMSCYSWCRSTQGGIICSTCIFLEVECTWKCKFSHTASDANPLSSLPNGTPSLALCLPLSRAGCVGAILWPLVCCKDACVRRQNQLAAQRKALDSQVMEHEAARRAEEAEIARDKKIVQAEIERHKFVEAQKTQKEREKNMELKQQRERMLDELQAARLAARQAKQAEEMKEIEAAERAAGLSMARMLASSLPANCYSQLCEHFWLFWLIVPQPGLALPWSYDDWCGAGALLCLHAVLAGSLCLGPAWHCLQIAEDCAKLAAKAEAAKRQQAHLVKENEARLQAQKVGACLNWLKPFQGWL